jgi:hypothetical protein
MAKLVVFHSITMSTPFPRKQSKDTALRGNGGWKPLETIPCGQAGTIRINWRVLKAGAFEVVQFGRY